MWVVRHARLQRTSPVTCSSWLNLFQWSFGELGDKTIVAGYCTALPELVTSTGKHTDMHDQIPETLLWTASAESIAVRVRGGQLRSTTWPVSDQSLW